MAARSSILTGRTLWAGQRGGLQSTGLNRVGCDWVIEHRPYTDVRA